MIAHLPVIVLSAAVFAGSLVSAFSGFAFSAIAGAILLHAFPPSEAVPLMMVCSTIVQGANLFCLRRIIEWRRSVPLILGGLFGIPPALYFLLHADATTFRVGFGIFLALYSVYMFARPKILKRTYECPDCGRRQSLLIPRNPRYEIGLRRYADKNRMVPPEGQ